MGFKLYLGVFLSIIISACTGYEKLLKSPDNVLKYDKALEYYANGEYERAKTLMEMIIPVYRGTSKAEKLNYLLADCYYQQDNFIEAGYYFETFAKTYPNNTLAELAEFQSAYCDYKVSPRPSLDQTYTYKAIDKFTLFIRRHPASNKVPECRELINELRDKLVYKSYTSAKLYYDLGNHKSAIVALRVSLSEFPDTRYREELMFLLLKANYLYADNSIRNKQPERFQNTIDEYYSFVSEFPESEFKKEAERIFNRSLSIVNKNQDNEDNNYGLQKIESSRYDDNQGY